ncbi:MAG: bifunctional phosphoribosyl-AMP cyclohydrolase/phosphoribosyl-ATP diphosphatase HisIE [Clostridia bacterium]|nr:bifunctional phosphoribosyl-AMP cyclohydrolase/phosphoribosyl-ATP diphosphatase HisIE [Clostridia bacterium]
MKKLAVDSRSLQMLKYGADGLIPAVVQDYCTGQVLTVAYMNAESLQISLQEGRTCFYSRSRSVLWRKGETSGNVQHIVSITADCDLDSLLVQVVKDGPACHTGEMSCFFNPIFSADAPEKFSTDLLYGLLLERKSSMPAGSYTTYLFEKGKEKILKKVGEESTEVVVAAMKGSQAETVNEAADLMYHMLVLLAQMGIPPEAVRKELQRRHVVDHKVKQEPLG